jgi:hypothetical protein
MKNFLIKATAIILLLLLFLCIVLEYRQHRSYYIPMHGNTTMIVKLNTDAFIKTFLAEYGFSFKNKVKPVDKKGKDTSLSMGLQLPANFFMYSVPLQHGDAFFCTLKLSDKEAFANYCLQHFKLPLLSTGPFMKGNRDKVTVLCNQEYAAIAYSPNNDEVTAILEDVLSKRNLLPNNHLLFQKLKKHREHIAFVSDSTVASVTISGKELMFHAVATTIKSITIPQQSKQRIFTKDACALFYCNGIPASSFFKQTYTVKQYTIDTDSILSRMKGYTDVELLGSSKQQDTITTYEYDDNFEKKEKQTVTQVKIPLLRMVCNTTSPSLINYLQQQGFVTGDGKLNKEVFPLYTVSVAGSNDQLQLQTGERQPINQQFVNSTTFLGATIDFIKLRTLHDFPLFNQYTKNINRLTFSGTQLKQQQVELDGTVLFQQSALHSLMELARGFPFSN